MATPAERYAAFRRRAATPEFEKFSADYEFPLDEFQVDACRAVEDGEGVLVAAPTGAGKTVVGEFAVHLALATGQKCFYTTPIKALSNQKYGDLLARHGADRKSTRLNSSHANISYAVFCLKKKKNNIFCPFTSSPTQAIKTHLTTLISNIP